MFLRLLAFLCSSCSCLDLKLLLNLLYLLLGLSLLPVILFPLQVLLAGIFLLNIRLLGCRLILQLFLLSLLLFLLVILLLSLRLFLLNFFLVPLGVNLDLGLHILCLLTFTVCKLLELSDKETVHVVDMRVDSAGQIQTGVEPLLLVLCVTCLPYFVRDAKLHEFDIASA